MGSRRRGDPGASARRGPRGAAGVGGPGAGGLARSRLRARPPLHAARRGGAVLWAPRPPPHAAAAAPSADRGGRHHDRLAGLAAGHGGGHRLRSFAGCPASDIGPGDAGEPARALRQERGIGSARTVATAGARCPGRRSPRHRRHGRLAAAPPPRPARAIGPTPQGGSGLLPTPAPRSSAATSSARSSSPAASVAGPVAVPGFRPTRPLRAHDQISTRLLAPAPRPAAAALDTVTVRRGDSLWSIAQRHLGATATDAEVAHAWPEWYAANRAVIGDDPDLIHPGMQLVPPREGDLR